MGLAALDRILRLLLGSLTLPRFRPLRVIVALLNLICRLIVFCLLGSILGFFGPPRLFHGILGFDLSLAYGYHAKSLRKQMPLGIGVDGVGW